MSNHSGSYMLNEILNLLNQEKAFASFDQSKKQSIIREIIKIATTEYDCNSGEILESLTDEFEMCYCCLKSSNNLEDGLCENCR
jgi:hypothetical protein